MLDSDGVGLRARRGDLAARHAEGDVALRSRVKDADAVGGVAGGGDGAAVDVDGDAALADVEAVDAVASRARVVFGPAARRGDGGVRYGDGDVALLALMSAVDPVGVLALGGDGAAVDVDGDVALAGESDRFAVHRPAAQRDRPVLQRDFALNLAERAVRLAALRGDGAAVDVDGDAALALLEAPDGGGGDPLGGDGAAVDVDGDAALAGFVALGQDAEGERSPRRDGGFAQGDGDAARALMVGVDAVGVVALRGDGAAELNGDFAPALRDDRVAVQAWRLDRLARVDGVDAVGVGTPGEDAGVGRQDADVAAPLVPGVDAPGAGAQGRAAESLRDVVLFVAGVRVGRSLAGGEGRRQLKAHPLEVAAVPDGGPGVPGARDEFPIVLGIRGLGIVIRVPDGKIDDGVAGEVRGAQPEAPEIDGPAGPRQADPPEQLGPCVVVPHHEVDELGGLRVRGVVVHVADVGSGAVEDVVAARPRVGDLGQGQDASGGDGVALHVDDDVAEGRGPGVFGANRVGVVAAGRDLRADALLAVAVGLDQADDHRAPGAGAFAGAVVGRLPEYVGALLPGVEAVGVVARRADVDVADVEPEPALAGVLAVDAVGVLAEVIVVRVARGEDAVAVVGRQGVLESARVAGRPIDFVNVYLQMADSLVQGFNGGQVVVNGDDSGVVNDDGAASPVSAPVLAIHFVVGVPHDAGAPINGAIGFRVSDDPAVAVAVLVEDQRLLDAGGGALGPPRLRPRLSGAQGEHGGASQGERGGAPGEAPAKEARNRLGESEKP